MRKLLLGLVVGIGLISCTENSRVKSFGGTGDINLPKGQKLVNVTWKETQIWYLTRPFKKMRMLKFTDSKKNRVGVLLKEHITFTKQNKL